MLPTTDLRQNIQRITLNKAPAGVPGSFKLLQIAGGRCLALVAAVRNWNLCRIDDSNPKKCKSSSKSLRLDIIKTVKLHVYLPTLGVSPPPSLPPSLTSLASFSIPEQLFLILSRHAALHLCV